MSLKSAINNAFNSSKKINSIVKKTYNKSSSKTSESVSKKINSNSKEHKQMIDDLIDQIKGIVQSTSDTKEAKEEVVRILDSSWNDLTKKDLEKLKKTSYGGLDYSKLVSSALKKSKQNAKLRKSSSMGDYDVGYYDSIAENATPQKVKSLADSTKRIKNSRRCQPPSYTDYVKYNHRIGEYTDVMRIGDVQIIIPPSFITVIDNSKHDSVGILRKKGTMNITRGFKKRYVNIVFYVNGIEQINGYEVPGPNGTYYVDGLRPLLAQFEMCPFVPVVNELLNCQFEIFNVSLANINVSTIPGYKNTLEVNLLMNEITLQPYTEMPDVMFHDMIDWDLFRYQYQRIMKKDCANIYFPKITETNDTSDNISFSFSVIDEKVLDGSREVTSVYGDECFIEKLSSYKNNIYLTDINFTISNVVPELQMSGYSIPTTQYMGSTDFTFTLNFECNDESCIKQIYEIKDYVEYLSNTYKEYGIFGFIKIDNKLINMVGCKFIIIDNIKISNMEGYPNAYLISMTCVSYDHTQKERENINGIRPFANNRKGTKNDAIILGDEGTYRKIKQDNEVEKRIGEMEMFPDLCLPTYNEVNKQIQKIIEFRNKYKLKKIGYKEYPKAYSIKPGIGPVGDYELYVDPDYYVFYPATYSSLDNSLLKSLNYNTHKIKPVSTIGKTYTVYNEDTSCNPSDPSVDVTKYKKGTKIKVHDYRSGHNGELTTIEYTDNNFVNICLSRAANGCGYAWGAVGQILTQSTLYSLKGTYGSDHKYDLAWSKWANKQVFDCSGMVSWALRQLGIVSQNWREGTGQMISDTTVFDNVSKSNLKIGDLCVKNTYKSGHVAIYIGNNTVCEARSTADGVCIGSLGNRFTHYKRIKNQKAMKSNNAVNSYKTNSTSGGTNDLPSYCSASNLNNHLKGTALEGKAANIIAQCLNVGVNPAFLISIFKQETGSNSTDVNSPASKFYNYGGLMGNGGLIHYKTPDEGLAAMARTIRNNYNAGNKTIEKFGDIYAHVGASNDPNGLNKYWIPNVKAFYKQITGSDNVQIMFNGSGLNNSSTTNSDNYTGKVISGTVEDFTLEGFGMPLFKRSPLMATRAMNLIDSDFNMAKVLSSFFTADTSGISSRISKSDLKDKYFALQNQFTTEYNRSMKSMYCDMFLYNHAGKMTKAFPSVLFLFEDEGGDWLDGRKLWTNYYLYKSIISVNIHQERSQPVHTATIKLSNIHHNLNTKIKNQDVYRINKDKGYLPFTRYIYEKTGSLIGSPKLTETMIKVKNTLYTQVNITTGLNIHIRLGYGSNPMMYPTVFNGCVTDINLDDTITIIAQSYGLELINQILSAEKNKGTSWNNLGSEPSNAIANILTLKNNEFLNSIADKWGESNKYGIEHFGNSQTNSALDMFDGMFNQLNNAKFEYDKLKNIYLGEYEEHPFCSDTDLFDGENNANFFMYNKTPWDAFQLLTQTLPSFVCQPVMHQFECRMFFGLPNWWCKYRYDIVKNKKGEEEVYETAKSFAQFHYIDSLTDIIDNTVDATRDNLSTNCISMYTLGSDLKSSPTVYSDRTIYPNYQNCKVIDTSLFQDYFGWDKLYEHLPFYHIDVGKQAAIRVAISNLIEAWNRNYDGYIMTLGEPTIKPCDYMYINDNYVNMYGLCGVREVVHTISWDTGYTTQITPDLLAFGTMKRSGIGNVYKSLLSFGTSYATVKNVRYAICKSSFAFNSIIALKRTYFDLIIQTFSNPLAHGTISAIAGYYTAGIFTNMISSGRIMTKLSDFLLEVKNVLGGVKVGAEAAKAAEGVKTATTVAQTAKAIEVAKTGAVSVEEGIKAAGATGGTLVAGPIGTLVGFLISTILIDSILQGVVDEFSYNHSVAVIPLIYHNNSFISGANGQTQLIVGINKDVLAKDVKTKEKNNAITNDTPYIASQYKNESSEDLF